MKYDALFLTIMVLNFSVLREKNKQRNVEERILEHI